MRFDANATADGAIAIGKSSDATSSGAIAIGGDGGDGDLLGAQATSGAAIAIGRDSLATEFNAVALGPSAEASGTIAVAVGQAADTTGTGATSVGPKSNSTDFSVAVGNNASAIGNQSVAIGSGAAAVAQNTRALGPATTALFAGSTALGAGAATTRIEQVVVGTDANTYTMPGITSAASAAAQSGPTELVTTDAAGNLATNGGMAFSAIRSNRRDIKRNQEGIALAIAMEAPYVPPTEVFATRVGWGNFEGENAFASSAGLRVHRNIQMDAGVGISLGGGHVGGGGGVTFHW